MLNDLVDESDPDIALPNIVHAFQVRILLKHLTAGKFGCLMRESHNHPGRRPSAFARSTLTRSGSS